MFFLMDVGYFNCISDWRWGEGRFKASSFEPELIMASLFTVKFISRDDLR
jgi:hypothetical protein